MNIFLTHIGEEATLAAVLKRWIKDTFSGKCEVFVSSDSDDIVPGDKWLNELDQALTDADLFLVLCSPRSVREPWINFETGCGWTKRVPLIPFCHSGQAKGKLPLPLSAFQAIDTSQSDFAKELLNAIAKKGSIFKVPPIDFVQMMKEIRDAEQADIATNDPPEPSATDGVEHATQDLQFRLLWMLVDHAQTVDGLSNRLHEHPVTVKFHLDELQEKRLVDWIGNMDPDIPDKYELAHEGRRRLVESGLLK